MFTNYLIIAFNLPKLLMIISVTHVFGHPEILKYIYFKTIIPYVQLLTNLGS